VNHFDLEPPVLALRAPPTFVPREASADPGATPTAPERRPRSGAAVDARGLGKRYGARGVLDDVDLTIAPGEFVAIVGRSGCGKSTLLRLLAGLEAADTGQITLDGDAHDRHHADIRILFQDARLLPWKRVLDNVALGLEARMHRSALARRCRRWVCPIAPMTGPPRSPVASVSGWHWRVRW
jgi:sulfonate transport system ATP-binding protein